VVIVAPGEVLGPNRRRTAYTRIHALYSGCAQTMQTPTVPLWI